MTGRLRLVAAVASGLIASFLLTGAALAQEPIEVTDVAVEQADGFATLSWDSVADATDYQIERTPVDADNVPTGPAVIVGVWRPNRTIAPGRRPLRMPGSTPVIASSGGSVRAPASPVLGPVFATTLPPWGDPAVPGPAHALGADPGGAVHPRRERVRLHRARRSQ